MRKSFHVVGGDHRRDDGKAKSKTVTVPFRVYILSHRTRCGIHGSCSLCVDVRESEGQQATTTGQQGTRDNLRRAKPKPKNLQPQHFQFILTMTEGTPLQTSFVFSFMRRGGGAKPKAVSEEKTEDQPQPPQPANPYENSIKTIAEVSTVQEFWSVYDFLKRPNDLPTTTDYHFFRGGIKPTWEDASNAKGGKWIVRLPKGLSSRYWEEMMLALIGGQFPGVPDGEICGAVLSIRYAEDILGVWNKSAGDRPVIDKIRDAIKKILQLPAGIVNMEYKPHQTSMQDRSSFRNTQVWKPKKSTARQSSWGEERKSTSGTRSSNRDSGRSWR